MTVLRLLFCVYALLAIVSGQCTFSSCPQGQVLPFSNDPSECYSFQDLSALVVTTGPDCSGVRSFNYNPNGFDYPVGIVDFIGIEELTGADDLTTECRFQVQVLDAETPTFTFCPSDIVEETSDPNGKVIFYQEPIFFDNCEGNTQLTLVAGSAPGATFPANGLPTTITYSANDGTNERQCTFTITVNFNANNVPSPTQTPMFIPSPSDAHSPTRASSFSPEASRDQITPSESNTPSRTPNASVTPTNTPTPTGTSTRTPSPSNTATPTSTQTPTSSPSQTPTNSAIPSSLTKSPYVPSQSPTQTPAVTRPPFVQQGTSTLVELVLPCNRDVCTFAEAQFYLTEVAFALDIPESAFKVFLEMKSLSLCVTPRAQLIF
jgi:hypothetical protein